MRACVAEGVTPLERYTIDTLSEAAQALFKTVLRERLLPFVTAKMPTVDASIRAHSQACQSSESPLCNLPFKYSDNEPAINRYSKGGQFDRHTDDHALTLNVLLDVDVGAFRGGGTEFWVEGDDVPAECEEEGDGSLTESETDSDSSGLRGDGWDPRGAVRLEPTAGVGVVFNGSVFHCGRVVKRGVRHLLVASFTIDSPKQV